MDGLTFTSPPKTKIVWREWYGAYAIAALEKLGTLPRYEIELDLGFNPSGGNKKLGEKIARTIAQYAHDEDAEMFQKSGRLTIVEPEKFAGDYDITVDYEPVFHASKL